MINLRWKTVAWIAIGVFIVASICLFILEFYHGTTRSDVIEIKDATFQINEHSYQVGCQLKELLLDNQLTTEDNLNQSLKSGETATISLAFNVSEENEHIHFFLVSVKNVLDHATVIQDAVIYKIEIDFKTIREDCGLMLMNTPVAYLINESEESAWIDRFGRPEIVGSLETKKYVWKKAIMHFDSNLIITREFGEHKSIIWEIDNINALF